MLSSYPNTLPYGSNTSHQIHTELHDFRILIVLFIYFCALIYVLLVLFYVSNVAVTVY